MVDHLTGELIACHECDHIYRVEPLPPGAKATCSHCGGLLYRNIPNSLERSLALYISALILFILANSYPFLSLEFSGRVVVNNLLEGGLALYRMGMGELGLLVFFTSILFPLAVIAGMIYLLSGALFMERLPPAAGLIYRIIHAVDSWSLVSVFMLAVLIAIVKLQDLANVITGTSLYALIGLLIIYSAARASFDPRALWSFSTARAPVNPSNLGVVLTCHACGLLHDGEQGAAECRRCNASLHRRKVGWRRHLGGVRVVVDPAFRQRGLASRLIDELIDIATREGLERLYAEIPAENGAALDVFRKQGFLEVARFERNVIDPAGTYHDLVVLNLDLA